MRHDTTSIKNWDYSDIVRTVAILSDTQYRIGDTVRELQRIRISPHTPTAQSPNMQMLLQNDVYGLLYKRSTPVEPNLRFNGNKSDFLIAVSHANCGSGTWEPGWRVLSHEADRRFRVASGKVAFEVGANELETCDGAPITVGVRCRVRIPKEVRQLNPYYYMAFGDTRLRDQATTKDVLLRYYWHLTPAAVVEYTRGITSALNHAAIPFRTKVLSDPQAYGAADAGVLYVDMAHRTKVEPLLMALHARLSDKLSASVPLFSRMLAPGLGHAQDPANGESFGVHRSRLVADGLWRAHTRGETVSHLRIRRMRDAFIDAGLDPDRPHLQPMENASQ
jgi:hypothetical protein